MRAHQLLEVFAKLDPKKRVKFQNGGGWGRQTMAVNAIIEEGNTYLLVWACNPDVTLMDLKEGQELIWFNPNAFDFKYSKNGYQNKV